MKNKNFFAAFLFLIMLSADSFAQKWTLLTPIKTESALRSVVMVNPSLGYLVDEGAQRFLRTDDGGLTFTRVGFAQSSIGKTLWMFNDTTGIVFSGGGFCLRTNNGWTSLTSIAAQQGMQSLKFNNDESVGIAVGLNGKIIRSVDKGLSWTTIGGIPSDDLFAVNFADDTTAYAAGESGKVLKTSDAGLTWTPVITGYIYAFNDILFATPLKGIAVNEGRHIYRTTNGGTTWDSVDCGVNKSINKLLLYGNVLHAVMDDGYVLQSPDTGLTWTNTLLGTRDLYTLHINKSGTGFIGGEQCLYKTIDFGNSWTLVQSGQPNSYLNKISFANDTAGIIAGYATTGGIYNTILRTGDGGKTWERKYFNTSGGATFAGAHMRSDGTAIVGGGSGAFRYSTDFAQNLSSHNGPSVAIRCAWALNDHTYIVGGGYINGGLYRSDNSGSTWTYTPGGSMQDIYFPSDSVGYAVGDGGSFMKTTDAGITWSASTTVSGSNTVYFLNDSVGFVDGAKTTNGGQTWTPIGAGNSYAVFFSSVDTGYSVTGSGNVLQSVDGGDTWNYFFGSTPNSDYEIRDAALVNGKIIAIGQKGDILSAEITCSAVPSSPTIIFTNDTLYSSVNSGNQWYNSAGIIPGATLNYYVPQNSNDYYVTATNTIGCSSQPSNNISVGFTAVQQNKNNIGFSVFPNPSTGKMQMMINGENKNYLLEVSDLQGKICFTSTIKSTDVTIDLSALSKGIYLLRLSNEKTVAVNKIIKL